MFGRRSKHQSKSSSKFDRIVQELFQLLEKYPNYSIYVTGHSLGGALATLTSFALAAMDNQKYKMITKPIVCLTIASPRVGGTEFRRAFQVTKDIHTHTHTHTKTKSSRNRANNLSAPQHYPNIQLFSLSFSFFLLLRFVVADLSLVWFAAYSSHYRSDGEYLRHWNVVINCNVYVFRTITM